ncbi:MAG: PilW family protein [Gammaproteobacteria bacterium]
MQNKQLNNRHARLPRQMWGLSLVELLIAMVLGLTLATGVIQIYVGTSTTERSQDARLRIQENGRFALNFLANEIRMAGYLGCLGSMEGNSANDTLNHPVNSTMQPGFGVQGWEAAGTAPGDVANSVNNVATIASTNAEWTGSEFAGFNIPTVQAVPNSDILRLWGGVGNASVVTDIDNSGTDPVITTTTDAGVEVNDFLIISDCEQADFVQACGVVDAGVTTTITLSTGCPMGNEASAVVTSAASTASGATAELIRLEGTLFYVGKRDDDANNPPALFRAVLDTDGTIAAPEELIEGVESMQLLYGVNTDQDVRATVDAWVTADNVFDWDEVIAIRLNLLMQSVEDGTVPSPQAYTFNGVTYDGAGGGNGALPADDRVRRVFQTTVSLRNRALGT